MKNTSIPRSNKMKIFASGFILFIMFSTNSFSQDLKIKPPVKQINTESYVQSEKVTYDSEKEKALSDIEIRMLSAKKSGNTDEVVRLQGERDKICGSVTMSGEPMDLKLIEHGAEQSDDIISGLVSSVTGVKGMNTCTEQLGSTASRIWTAFVYGPNNGVVNDHLRLCYSDDGGMNWTEKADITFSTANRMLQDQIDIELIENTTGDKFIWVVFGYATNNYSGAYRVGVTIIRITGDLNFAGYTLNWPGAVSSNYYWKPRVVSDNEAYHSNPWVYITTCFDSAISGGYMSGEKIAICYSPFTVIPTFTYKPLPFKGLLYRYPADYNCDIAFFRNGGLDSIMVIETSLLDSSRILLNKTSISNFASGSYSTSAGILGSLGSRRYQAYIASAGGYNNLMIVNMRKYSPTDWDIEYFSSTNGSAGWSTGYVDYRANNSTRADICGFRSAPGFYSCASSENTVSFVPAVYYSATNNVWGNIISQVNHINTNPFTAQPRAGVRYGPEGESCFTLWTEYSGSTNVWASVGCSGNVKAYRHLFFRGVVEGLWDAPADTMKSDTMKIYLRKDFSPYEITDSAKAFLTNDGYGDFWFTNALNLTSYYVVAKHRNSLETWSSDKITFSPVFAEYNFANDPSMTYGNNVTQVDTDPLYAFYSGDVNDDDAIDLSDVIIINNDAGIFTSGYIISDLNGDNTTDLSDVLLAKNNASGFVALIRP
ncbi:MAG: hypothetical protein KBF96_07885 [Ignavibacteria bacterium]|nr:hypothetical protein [Ignavibacteria bacterium]